jgi:RNA polymerase-binding transcription factor DksA
VDCGREIPAARLEAQPEAIRCVEDQRRFEAAHRVRANRPEGGAADLG